MDSAPCLSIHQCSNCPKFQSNYNSLGNRFSHGRRPNQNTFHTKINRHKNKVCVKALFGAGGDDFRAVTRIIKLHSAIQNRSIRELFELISDECQYLLNSIPPIDVSQLSKNVFPLLHAMMLRHNVSFVLKPTADEGFDLGVKWSLEWKGNVLPWDLNCNLSTTHVYRGLLLISKVNKTFVPFLQNLLQIIQMNLDAIILTLMNKVLPEGVLEENKRGMALVYAIISLVVMVMFYALFKNVQV